MRSVRPDAKGRLNVNIHGKHFVGEIEQHDHEGHEHDIRIKPIVETTRPH